MPCSDVGILNKKGTNFLFFLLLGAKGRAIDNKRLVLTIRQALSRRQCHVSHPNKLRSWPWPSHSDRLSVTPSHTSVTACHNTFVKWGLLQGDRGFPRCYDSPCGFQGCGCDPNSTASKKDQEIKERERGGKRWGKWAISGRKSMKKGQTGLAQGSLQ